MKTKIWAEFIINKFPMKHEELTKLLEIVPTKAENAGDTLFHPNGKSYVLKHSSWTLDSGCKSNVGFSTPIVTLLEKIRPKKDRFVKMCEKYTLFLNVVIHIYGDERPYIGWESKIMKELAEYNASWGIDLSVYKENEWVE